MKTTIRCKCGKLFVDDKGIRKIKDKYGYNKYVGGHFATEKFRGHIWNIVRRAKRNHFKTKVQQSIK